MAAATGTRRALWPAYLRRAVGSWAAVIVAMASVPGLAYLLSGRRFWWPLLAMSKARLTPASARRVQAVAQLVKRRDLLRPRAASSPPTAETRRSSAWSPSISSRPRSST